MDFSSRAFSLEDEGKLRKLSYLRLVIATLVIGAAIMLLQLDNRVISVVALYSLLGAIYLTTGSSYLVFTTGVPLRIIIWMQILVDLTVLTLMIHYSGGSASYFAMLYILPVIVGGVYYQVPGGIVTAAIASLIYIVYSYLEFTGYIKYPLGIWFDSSYGVYKTLLHGYLNIAVFFFTGLLSGFVSKHVRRKHEALADREEELHRVQLDTDNILKNMSSGLIVTNVSGEIVSLNPAAVTILGLDEVDALKGKRIDYLERFVPSLYEELSCSLTTGASRKRYEIELERADHSVLPLGISISILKDAEERRRGIIALFQDLTEVHQMREQVRQADKMAAIGELSAAIAHEIRAPLASICGSIEMLAEELELSGDNRKLMDLVIKESDRLDSIITDFLEFARPRTPSLKPMDVNRCIDEVVELLRYSSSLKESVSVGVMREAADARIRGDDEQIRQVFLNMGLNAGEATDGGGEVNIVIRRVSTQLRDGEGPVDCINVDVINTGKPIPADVLKRVFEPFFTTKEGGTGLGLAIAEKIVDGHHGLIQAKSTETGVTTFSVILPACTDSVRERDSIIQEEVITY